MICDVENTRLFKKYLCLKGPYVITFYQEDKYGHNFNLYSRLKDLERSFNDIPIIRFDYFNFTQIYSSFNIPSSNHILLIEFGQCNKLYDFPDKNKLNKILIYVRQKLLLHKKIFNEAFKFNNKTKMRPWTVNSCLLRINDINEFLDMSAIMRYKFPNSTSFLKRKEKYRKPKKNQNNLEITSSKEELYNSLSISQIKNESKKQLDNTSLEIPEFLQSADQINKKYVSDSISHDKNSLKSNFNKISSSRIKKAKDIYDYNKIISHTNTSQSKSVINLNSKQNIAIRKKSKYYNKAFDIRMDNLFKKQEDFKHQISSVKLEQINNSISSNSITKIQNSNEVNFYESDNSISNSIKEVQNSNSQIDFNHSIPNNYYNGFNQNVTTSSLFNHNNVSNEYVHDFNLSFLPYSNSLIESRTEELLPKLFNVDDEK